MLHSGATAWGAALNSQVQINLSSEASKKFGRPQTAGSGERAASLDLKQSELILGGHVLSCNQTDHVSLAPLRVREKERLLEPRIISTVSVLRCRNRR